MIYNIFGRSGSGKTEYILQELKRYSDRQCIIIVPEQQALVTERLLSLRLGDNYNMFCEILNFERLSDRVFREYGGVARKYIDEGGRDILMSVALERLSGKLKQYNNTGCGADYIRKMLSAINSFKQSSITPAILLKLAESPEIIQREPMLSDKLSDLSIIMAYYQSLFTDCHDPKDRPEHLIDILRTYHFFENKTVFIDGYYTYTAQEYELLEIIFKQCDNAYITFCCPLNNSDPSFGEIKTAYVKVRCAEDMSKHEIKQKELTTNHRTGSAELQHLEVNIWNTSAKPVPAVPNDIHIYECSNMFEEAEAAASEICTLVREKGYRYRDIGIAVRSSDNYGGVIDAVFEKYKIPTFMSIKEDITIKPLISLIFSAVEAVVTDFSPQSVKRYIKSSFSRLTREESDFLSAYIDMWKIRGKSRYTGIDWQMNPDGYREQLSKYSEHILVVVTEAKDKLNDTLIKFAEEISGRNITAAECASAIYSLLTDIDANKKIVKDIEEAKNDGDEEHALELKQLWDIIVAVLDQLYLVGGNEIVTSKRLLELLKIITAEYEIGKLPTSVDEVIVADARLARFDNIKALIILGVNEGVFPAAERNGELFNESEQRILEKVGFESIKSIERRLTDEQFLFYITISAPSERLSLYYSAASSSGSSLRASVAINRVIALFPELKVIVPAKDRSYFIQTVETAFDYFIYLPEPIKLRILLESGYTFSPLTVLSATVDGTLLSKIRLSPSSLERYSLCPFSFFTKYVLKLRAEKAAAFEAGEVGTFIHKLLEMYLKNHQSDIARVDRTKINDELQLISADFINLISNNNKDIQTDRLSFTISRLTNLVKIFIENISDEFAQSRFSPLGFEMHLGSEHTPSGEMLLDDGRILNINGVIDRVDYYEKDDKTYIRIVDYKSGYLTYSPVAPVYGLSLQMFLYLFSWCKKNESNFVPAGVLYMPVKPPVFKSAESDIKHIIPRSGLVLQDYDIIEAMESEPSKKFIPVSYNTKLNADGTPVISKNSSVATDNEFDHIHRFIRSRLTEFSCEIEKGNIEVNPLVIDALGKDACKGCEFLPVCRNSRNRKRRLEKLSKEEACEILYGKSDGGEKK
ncbi:MAG: hypothetical protein A2Y17_07655 [Clostridiales bacterium GWF2_38_85]|nr:MAG: hypothetical protein A2Y17_07655 [Clostridiales bacterium GWF2_38_85]